MENKQDPENHEKPKEKAKTSNSNTESKIIIRIPSLVRETLTNPFFAKYIARSPLATNIAFVLLMYILGINLGNVIGDNPSKKENYTIKNTQNLCHNYQEKLHLEADDYIQEVDVLTKEGFVSSPGQKSLFECLYKVRKSDGLMEERKLNVDLYVVDSELTNHRSSEEETSEKIDINQVCQEPKTYQNRLKINQQKGDFILKREAILLKTKDIWPVFRWQCQYTYRLKEDEGGFSESYTKSIGLDLNAYCKERFPEKPHASHQHYNDPYSLYCNYPHPDR